LYIYFLVIAQSEKRIRRKSSSLFLFINVVYFHQFICFINKWSSKFFNKCARRWK